MAIASRVRKRDGRRVYDVRLRDPSGHVYTRTFETKRQAQAFETTEKADRARGGWIDPRRATTHFEDVAAAWLHSSPNKRDSALARDTSVLTYHLLPAFQGRPIGSIVRGDVEGLVTAWIGKQPPATVVRQYATLRAIFNYAVTSELIARSPCRGVRLPQAHPRRAKILTSEELQRLAASMGDYALMPYLAVVLPLRWGEIAGLRVGSIDFLRQTIAVTRQRTRGTKGRMIEEDPKSEAGKRTLAVSDWLMTLLADHLATRGVTGAESDALMFLSPDGNPLHYSNWRSRVWVPATQAANLVGLNFHDLRKTAGTALVAEGIDVKTAQTRLGHANPQITLRVYAQATEQADRAAAKRIGDLFRPRDGRAMGDRTDDKKRPGKGA